MIVVIGAGPAGLAVAWGLSRAGQQVVVLDAAERVGGTSASPRIGGVPVDLGHHGFDQSMPAPVRALLDGLVELQPRHTSERIRIAGRWLPVPATPVGLARHLPAGVTARVARDAATRRLRPLRGNTYADVVRHCVGSTLWRRVHAPWAWKVWGVDPGSLAGELARPGRAPAADRAPLLLRRFGARRPLLHPRDGNGSVWEAIASAVPDVRLSTKVTGLLEHDDRVIVGLADGRILTASHVFSTLPAGVTASWLGLTPPDDVAVAHRSLVLVSLTLERRRYSPFDAHLLPDRAILPTRVSEPVNLRGRTADRTVLCAEIPCWAGDAVWGADDDELALRVRDDLVRSGLPDPRPVSVETARVPSAYPVLTTDSLRSIAHARHAVERSRRVTALGAGLLDSSGCAEALEVGLAAARYVDAVGRFDQVGWRGRHDQD